MEWQRTKRNKSAEPTIIGIDNGLDGGFCQIGQNTGKIYRVAYMPTRPLGKSKEVDAEGVMYLLHHSLYDQPEYIAIEQPLKHARSSQAMRSMGISFGTIRAVSELCCAETYCYFPMEWQRPLLGKFKRGTSKEAAEAMARKLQPSFEWEIKRSPRSKKKVHDGIVDAYLVAEHHRRQMFS